MPTQDAPITKNHIIFLNYWAKKAMQNTVAHTYKKKRAHTNKY